MRLCQAYGERLPARNGYYAGTELYNGSLKLSILSMGQEQLESLIEIKKGLIKTAMDMYEWAREPQAKIVWWRKAEQRQREVSELEAKLAKQNNHGR